MRNRVVVPILFVVHSVLLVSACGTSRSSSPAAPSPTASTPVASAAPVAQLTIRVDDLDSTQALAGVSDVLVDASASTGASALTFAIDFGDGSSAATQTARHVYRASGTYTIRVTVTDAQGRTGIVAKAVAVTTLVSRWFEAQYVERTQRVEVRRLTITEQDGASVRGIYQVTGDADRSFTGTLTPPRTIRLSISGGATLEGVVPTRVGETASTWRLQSSGDTLNGALEFRAIVGEPTGPPPDARLGVSWDERAQGRLPIALLTPIRIDGSASTGTGLLYFAEFGDGFVSTASAATHVIEQRNFYGPARVTVVDAFGRVDSEAERLSVITLADNVVVPWWRGLDGEFSLIFRTWSGMTFAGTALGAGPGPPSTTATATLSGTRDVHIVVPEWDIELKGTIDFPQPNEVVMTVLQVSGTRAGRILRFQYTATF